MEVWNTGNMERKESVTKIGRIVQRAAAEVRFIIHKNKAQEMGYMVREKIVCLNENKDQYK